MQLFAGLIYLIFGIVCLFFWPNKKVSLFNTTVFFIGGVVGFIIGILINKLIQIQFSVLALLCIVSSFLLVASVSGDEKSEKEKTVLFQYPLTVVKGAVLANLLGLLGVCVAIESFYLLGNSSHEFGKVGPNIAYLMAFFTTPVSFVCALFITNLVNRYTIIHGLVITLSCLFLVTAIFKNATKDILYASITYSIITSVSLSFILWNHIHKTDSVVLD